MNYNSITDKPFIVGKPGKTVKLCADCLVKKYTNEPPSMSQAFMCCCPVCGEIKTCREYDKVRLIAKPVKPRKTISIAEKFNISRRPARK